MNPLSCISAPPTEMVIDTQNETPSSDESMLTTSTEVNQQAFVGQINQAITERSENPYNFCAGPGINFNAALQNVVRQMISYDNGIGIQEMSHRDPGGPVQQLMQETKERAIRVLEIPDNYDVLFMTGGAHFQFDAVPANLMGEHNTADFIDGGFWSKRALSHVNRQNPHYQGRLVEVLERDPVTNKLGVKPVEQWALDPQASYVHICDNETISGIQFKTDPELLHTDERPLVSDATSSLLCRKVDISQYGVIYASGGKNLGPAGITLVIVRKDLLRNRPNTPLMQEYKNCADHNSLYNTPNIIPISFLNETLRIAEELGLDHYEARAQQRAQQIYDVIDQSQGFYTNDIADEWRSITTIPFTIQGGNPPLEQQFIEQAGKQGFHQLHGHHSVGGLRISLYNAVSDEAVNAFIDFLRSFQDSAIQPNLVLNRV